MIWIARYSKNWIPQYSLMTPEIWGTHLKFRGSQPSDPKKFRKFGRASLPSTKGKKKKGDHGQLFRMRHKRGKGFRAEAIVP